MSGNAGAFEIVGGAGAGQFQGSLSVRRYALFGGQGGTDVFRPRCFFLLSFYELRVKSTGHTSIVAPGLALALLIPGEWQWQISRSSVSPP